jgi:hypothetical protein
MFKFSCEHCNGHIECDYDHSGVSVKCPHCFEVTKLIPLQTQSSVPEQTTESKSDVDHFKDAIPAGEWMREPMSDKQKAMFILYGIPLKDGLTKGDASALIDNAIQAGIKPSKVNQAKASDLFGRIRVSETIDEINDAIRVIGDETATIKELKETKKKLKESIRKITELIDMRIQTNQDENREVRYEKTAQWLREHGINFEK